ncbi:hypothetical protein CAPTEDRAFT_196297 [Capitella teleta]|uniref:Uncharacterized protein n=1 Tax=Capitella teleta TaxID=283909 RepID=R7T4E2_CAPTE|nr:hypothetical protein CAPTEDRAFT_196297 [Capitella teleta]|eukprot:ELT87872.1 hypothetical protein CAPTEDRAFT_196297 [Capitella teleta]
MNGIQLIQLDPHAFGKSRARSRKQAKLGMESLGSSYLSLFLRPCRMIAIHVSTSVSVGKDGHTKVLLNESNGDGLEVHHPQTDPFRKQGSGRGDISQSCLALGY